jgi:hypothetical protein
MGETDASAALTVYIFLDVAEELLFSARCRPSQTMTGILTGGYFEGPAGDYVEVRGFRDAVVVDSTLDYAERFSREWEMVQAAPDLVESGLIPVGWFVSRPGCRGQPGPFELIAHMSYFNLPHHQLFVMDPVSRTAGLYCQEQGGDEVYGRPLLRNIGFNLIETTARDEVSDDGYLPT